MALREQITGDLPADEALRVLATKTMAVRGFPTEARQPLLDFLADVYDRPRFSALAIGKKRGDYFAGTFFGRPYLDFYLLLSEASNTSLFSEDCEQEIADVGEKHVKIPHSSVLEHNIHVIYPQRYPSPQLFIKELSYKFRQEPGARLIGTIIFNR